MTAYYETFKRTDKSDNYVYRAIRYNIFKHRAINRLTYGAFKNHGLIELISLHGRMLIEIPDEGNFKTVFICSLKAHGFNQKFTPFDPGPYVLSGGVPCGNLHNSK